MDKKKSTRRNFILLMGLSAVTSNDLLLAVENTRLVCFIPRVHCVIANKKNLPLTILYKTELDVEYVA